MRRLLFAAIFVFASVGAQAQVQQTPSDSSESTAKPRKFIDPEDGKLDVSEFLANPYGFLPIPFVITEPAIGYGGGIAGMFLRPRREAGEEGWARPNISGVGAFGTQNGTWGGFVGDSSLWHGGRLKTLAGIGAGRVNLDFYGLGFDPTSLDRRARYSLEFAGAVGQANWRLGPKSPWWIGMRYVYAKVEPSLREDPAFPTLAEAARMTVTGPTAVLEYDTRDNIFTPNRGVYAESSLLVSRERLGATEQFERFQQLLMGWMPLSPKLTLGARGNYAWTSAETPFFLRPFVILRGVPAMRYQGDQMASLELEARWRLQGRWSAIVFGGVGATKTTTGPFDSRQDVASGGVGVRYEIARKFGLHVGVDVAHSPGTNAIYLQVGNAWFRP